MLCETSPHLEGHCCQVFWGQPGADASQNVIVKLKDVHFLRCVSLSPA